MSLPCWGCVAEYPFCRWRPQLPEEEEEVTMVFRPGPVQYSGSRFWPGHQVLTGSPGHPGYFFLKSIRRRFSKKNKSQLAATRFLTWSTRSHQVFSFPIFSWTRPGSSLESSGSRVDPPGRVSKLWKEQCLWNCVVSGWERQISMWSLSFNIYNHTPGWIIIRPLYFSAIYKIALFFNLINLILNQPRLFNIYSIKPWFD
jgi:hypothetical protein